MGANLVRRLVRDGHTCVVFDVNAATTASLAAESDAITGADSLEDLVAKLDAPARGLDHGAGGVRRLDRRRSWRR